MIDKKLKYKDQKLTKAQQKKAKAINSAGIKNYINEQETVTVPKKWLSSPDHVVAELAYITPREQKILLDADLYGSLNGQPNRGPGGIMSLQGAGDGGGSENAGTGGNDGYGGGGGGGGGGSGNYVAPPPGVTTVSAPKSSDKTSPMQDAQQERKSKEVGFDQNDRSNPYSEASKTAIDNFNQDIADRQADREKEAVLEQIQAGKIGQSKLNPSFFDEGLGKILKNTAKGVAYLALPQLLPAKLGTLYSGYKKAEMVAKYAKKFGITDTNVISSLINNIKDGGFGGFNNTTSSLSPNDRNGGETIPGQTLSPGIEGTQSSIENVIGSLPNASRQDQQSMTFSPRYTRSNVANESEKGIANLKGMGESFADVFKTDTNIPGDGETSSLVKEYVMLLQKMEKGLLQTEGRERLNILKSRLGLAQGGITNVNMNRGKPGEVLSKLGELLYG